MRQESDVRIAFFNADKLEDILKRAHEIEHKGDQVNHAIHSSVSVDFITPIEREDISELALKMENYKSGLGAKIEKANKDLAEVQYRFKTN